MIIYNVFEYTVLACMVIQDYYQSGRMLVRMAEAIGRIVLAGREMTRLSGSVNSGVVTSIYRI